MIFWAHKRARENGMQAAMQGQVRWFGDRGMCWGDLMGKMTELLQNFPPPDKLVIHLGGNDLGKVPVGELIYKIRKDLRQLARMLPGTTMVWSDLTARSKYRHAICNAKVEKARKTLNRAAHKIVVTLKGIFVEHKKITWDKAELYHDGVHMSDLGNDILLNDWFIN